MSSLRNVSIRRRLRHALAVCQLWTAQIAYFVLRFSPSRRHRRRFTIGAQDIMKNISFMRRVLGAEQCYTVCGRRFPLASAYDPTKKWGWELYEDLSYDFGFHAQWERVVKLPFVLAWLAHQTEVFIYLGSHGFLVDESRELEYCFLKKRGRKIVAMFVGCDIRQREKAADFFRPVGHDFNCAYCHRECSAAEKENRAVAALRYCDAVFSSRDQPGYLWDKYIPLDGMSSPVIDVDDYAYVFNPDFSNGPVVLHAPTNTVYKGTPFVRQAVTRLKSEGYKFEYVELIGVPNSVVMEQLKRSHIVLNQFFGVMPGLFGVEAMATGNAVLSSATLHLNPDLPPSIPIVPTVGHQIYDNLKQLILEPHRIEPLARASRQYVEEYHDYRTAGRRFAVMLESVLAGSARDVVAPAPFPPAETHGVSRSALGVGASNRS
jgi:hypothetical protein